MSVENEWKEDEQGNRIHKQQFEHENSLTFFQHTQTKSISR